MQNHVAGLGKPGDHSQVGLVPGREKDGVLRSLEMRQTLFELPVDSGVTVQQRGTPHANAVLGDGTSGTFSHVRMVREAQIVVRAEHQHLPEAARVRVFHDDLPVGGRYHLPHEQLP